MGSGFYRQITKILKEHGYEEIDGGKGSHRKWKQPQNPVPLTIPYNLKRRHTANKILKKDAKIDKKL